MKIIEEKLDDNTRTPHETLNSTTSMVNSGSSSIFLPWSDYTVGSGGNNNSIIDSQMLQIVCYLGVMFTFW